MEVRRLFYLFLLQFLYLSSICNCQYEKTYKFLSTSDYTRGYKQSYTVGYTGNPMQRNCKVEKKYSGEIYFNSQNDVQQCWKIEVPQNNYVRINLTELRTSLPCHQENVKISVSGTDEEFMFCGQDTNRKPVIALNDVHITYSKVFFYNLIFKIDYNIENLICTRKEHFRCSNHSCIYQYQVCDGVTDCENGADEKGCETGVAGVSGVNISRENAITWLKNQWSVSFGWGKNTPRAIIALYLAGSTIFNGVNLTGELMANQLELQTSVALLRNSTDPISVSDLSMFINALTITCHNPRQFYGYDLLRILSEQVVTLKSPSPAAYLTLCNGNWTFAESHVESLLRILHKHSEYPFHFDVQAMTIMALTCVRNKTKMFENIQNATKLYNSTIQKFIDRQLHDGSFGNVYTTALVTQALLSSGQQNNKLWKINSTVKYLMKELNTSADFLSTYLALPVFNDKSLNDIANVNCSNHRKHGEDDDITDVMNKLGGKVRVQYSLFVGDHKDVIHTMYMSTPANISAFEVMKLAQVVDQKYKFMHRDVLGHIYVYTIAGITNDPEAGKFWLLYTGDSHINGTVHHHTKSPDKYILADGDHLIMWYKTAHI